MSTGEKLAYPSGANFLKGSLSKGSLSKGSLSKGSLSKL
jgi:hypothetical protein